MLIMLCLKIKIRYELLLNVQLISIEGFDDEHAYRWVAIWHKFHVETLSSWNDYYKYIWSLIRRSKRLRFVLWGINCREHGRYTAFFHGDGNGNGNTCQTSTLLLSGWTRGACLLWVVSFSLWFPESLTSSPDGDSRWFITVLVRSMCSRAITMRVMSKDEDQHTL